MGIYLKKIVWMSNLQNIPFYDEKVKIFLLFLDKKKRDQQDIVDCIVIKIWRNK